MNDLRLWLFKCNTSINFTVAGSSRDSSSSARRRNTLPRLIRHNIRSKPGTRSRGTTPATNLVKKKKINNQNRRRSQFLNQIHPRTIYNFFFFLSTSLFSNCPSFTYFVYYSERGYFKNSFPAIIWKFFATDYHKFLAFW